MTQEDIIGRWFDMYDDRKTYFRPEHISSYGERFIIIGIVVEDFAGQVKIGKSQLAVDSFEKEHRFTEENAVNSKVVYEYFNKIVKKAANDLNIR